MRGDMIRTVLLWALVLALGAFALQWLEYRFLVRAFSWQLYVGLIGAAFAVGGVWVGFRLAARARPETFARNDAALASLGLTGQEVKVLELLAAGRSNKEIARDLSLSEDTVKGHMRSIFSKLDVTDRTQAVTVGHRRGIIQL